MILYRPTDGDVHSKPVECRPRTCFIMTKIKEPIPNDAIQIREKLSNLLSTRRLNEIDATSIVTGRDYLLKIWRLIVSVPMGIAIITREMSKKTLGNIFYEIGLLQAYGKETLIIKTTDCRTPSDFIRTEHIEYDADFEVNLGKYFDTVLMLPSHFEMMSELLENDPLLAIDYLRRAFLITGDSAFRIKARDIYASRAVDRAKDSVEMLLLSF